MDNIEDRVPEKKVWDISSFDHWVKSDYEGTIKNTHRERMGQFFTPGNVIDMMLDILSPKPNDVILDPAAGCGNMLIHVHNYLCNSYYGSKPIIKGIEKDEELVNISQRIHKVFNLESHISVADTLTENILDNSVDIIINNPPFGKKLLVRDAEVLRKYQNGYRPDGTLKISERIEILFLEKCVKMLKEGGRMGIILPDGILGNEESSYIREWLLRQGRVNAVVSLPKETFMPFTSVKTSVLFFEKKQSCNYNIFMAIADSCGHDKRGKRIPFDDIKKIAEMYSEWDGKSSNNLSHE